MIESLVFFETFFNIILQIDDRTRVLTILKSFHLHHDILLLVFSNLQSEKL